jgi:hypothetical protein
MGRGENAACSERVLARITTRPDNRNRRIERLSRRTALKRAATWTRRSLTMSSYSIDAASIVVDPAALVAAWRKLAKQLEDAFFRGGRPAVIEQLLAVLTFLEAVDSGGLAIPLNALFGALGGLDFGITDPLLKPKDRSGRPRERFSRLILKGQTAATMTIFMEDMQYSRQSAAETTAKILRECGPTFKNVTWR